VIHLSCGSLAARIGSCAPKTSGAEESKPKLNATIGGVNYAFEKRSESGQRRTDALLPNDDVKLRSRVWARGVIAAHQTDLKVSNHRAGHSFAIS